MNKKVWLGFIGTFITLEILEAIVNFVILNSAYQASAQVWGPI
jgi:hypothetical protein